MKAVATGLLVSEAGCMHSVSNKDAIRLWHMVAVSEKKKKKKKHQRLLATLVCQVCLLPDNVSIPIVREPCG